MLHYETISPDCRELLTQLMRMPELKRFRLVGGTALSLQYGHRVSVDIDLFTDKTFDEDGLERTLLALHPTSFSKERTTSTGFSCYVAGVKIDFYNWPLPFIRPVIVEDEIRICHPEEISAMKLDVIGRRQEKKDFFDLYLLLKKYPLPQMVKFYREKYPLNNLKVVLEILQMPHLADPSPDPQLLTPFHWDEVKPFISDSVSSFFQHLKEEKEKALQDRIAKAEALLKNRPSNTGN